MEGGDIEKFAAQHGLPVEACRELTQLLQAAVVSQKKRVSIRVPATIGNLGPGLDCFGLAVDIWDEFLVENASNFSIDVMGEAAVPWVPRDATNLVVKGAELAYQMRGEGMPPLHFRCDCRIPSAKGLGSEVAAFTAGFMAGFILSEKPMKPSGPSVAMKPSGSAILKIPQDPQSPAALLKIPKGPIVSNGIDDLKHSGTFCMDGDTDDDLSIGLSMQPMSRGVSLSVFDAGDVASLCIPNSSSKTQARCYEKSSSKSEMTEHLLSQAMVQGWSASHVGSAVHGGAQITLQSSDGWACHRVPFPPGLVCIIFCPDERPVSGWCDKAADGDMVARRDAVFNVGRVGMLVNSFITGNFTFMKSAMEDRLHQPGLMQKCPHIAPVIQAAYDAGAAGSSVSGAGPSIVAFLTSRSGDIIAHAMGDQLENKVAEAMLAAAKDVGVSGRILISKPIDSGAHISAQRSDIAGANNGNIQYFQ